MVTFISHRAEETQALGEEWAQLARPGWVIGLSGDLGAGKTQLVKGLARGLGIAERVHSPTFSLVNVYRGERFSLAHLDLYRLQTSQEMLDAGLEEYLAPSGVTVIEWAEKWLGPTGDRTPPPGYRSVHITALGETQRQILYEDFSG